MVAAAGRADSLTFLDRARFCFKVVWNQVCGRCDFIFFDHLGLARAQALVPGVFRRPYGIFLHSIEAWNPLGGNQLKVLVNARLLVSNSCFTAARIAAAHPGVGAIEVCHLTIEPEMPEVMGESAPPVNQISRNSVLVVGRMMQSERYKGHDELLAAWPLVLKEAPDAQLVIVGGGDDAERLKTLARDLKIEPRVLFMGRVDDATLQAIYQKATIFAMPSRAEGFGIVYLEAMAHKLACVGSIHDAAREVIVDGETGFLVNQDNPHELASKIVLLLNDPGLRKRLGCNGFERLQRNFSFQRFERRMSELLSQLETAP